jgi:hypothetical protein
MEKPEVTIGFKSELANYALFRESTCHHLCVIVGTVPYAIYPALPKKYGLSQHATLLKHTLPKACFTLTTHSGNTTTTT